MNGGLMKNCGDEDYGVIRPNRCYLFLAADSYPNHIFEVFIMQEDLFVNKGWNCSVCYKMQYKNQFDL